jgi:competence protein ComEA
MLKKLLICLFVLSLPCCFVQAAPEATGSAEHLSTNEVLMVNINTATAEEMATLLQGIGLKKAQAIVMYRKQHGSFKQLDELREVKGIGPHLLKINQTRIQLH